MPRHWYSKVCSKDLARSRETPGHREAVPLQIRMDMNFVVTVQSRIRAHEGPHGSYARVYFTFHSSTLPP